MNNLNLWWNDASEIDKNSFSVEDVFEAWEKHHSIANTAWPIAHKKTMRDYKVPRKDIQKTMIDSWKNTDELCLYTHIPFCEKICKFCEYTVIDPKIKEKCGRRLF